jgi:hypothetical protein
MKHNNELIRMNTRFCIDPVFLLDIYMDMEGNQINLERDTPYPSKKLCSKTFWSALSNGDKKLAGMCISEIVKYGLINLRAVKGVHEYPKLYELK